MNTLFPAPHLVPPASPRRIGLAEALFRVREQLAALEAAEDEILAELTKEVPPDPGAYELPAGGYVIRAERAETWRWDKKKLEEMFAQGDVPPFVKRGVSIDREKFEALPIGEQALLLPLLKRRAAPTPTIEVVPYG